ETDRSIKEIAELTGFANTSFFGKYVKHNTGLTPKELRERK
ncbi:MAG: AraC family transcriptional regulator, partial [Bacteroidales bacterium]|nr:AraC family transcriptional regulator [Bacteroidales bacterium]